MNCHHVDPLFLCVCLNLGVTRLVSRSFVHPQYFLLEVDKNMIFHQAIHGDLSSAVLL